MFSNTELMDMEDLCREDSRYKKYIEQLQKENTSLLSKVTHEIGNPLTVIYSTIQLMESQNPALKEERNWTQLFNDIKELSSLIHDYMDYNSYDNLTLHRENLFTLLQSVNSDHESVMIGNNLHFTFQLSRDMLFSMKSYLCDGAKLKHAFSNIIKHFTDAMDVEHDLWIEVPEKGTDLNGVIQGEDFILIQIGSSVTDVDAPQLNGTFLPPISSTHDGINLGLFVANRIVSAHGGTIYVDSTDAETTFTICLPR